MLARSARRMGTSLPQLLGRRMTPLEFRAASEVAAEWTLLESLAVVVAERVDWLRWITQAVNSRRDSSIAEPFRMPRPGEKPRNVMSAKEFAESVQGGGE